MTFRRFVLMAAALLMSSCTSQSRQPLSADHPASPDAAESPPQRPSETLLVIEPDSKTDGSKGTGMSGMPGMEHDTGKEGTR
jgi:mono/diheme cytochrome c family protein